MRGALQAAERKAAAARAKAAAENAVVAAERASELERARRQVAESKAARAATTGEGDAGKGCCIVM